MNNLTSRALELQRLAHELIYLGVDGELSIQTPFAV